MTLQQVDGPAIHAHQHQPNKAALPVKCNCTGQKPGFNWCRTQDVLNDLSKACTLQYRIADMLPKSQGSMWKYDEELSEEACVDCRLHSGLLTLAGMHAHLKIPQQDTIC